MKMNRVVCTVAVIIFVFVPLNLRGQTPHSNRERTSGEMLNVQLDGCTDPDNNAVSFNHVSIREFLSNVQGCSQMPIGVVLLPDYGARRYDFKPQSLKLKDVLES